jgi:hypothetical protein
VVGFHWKLTTRLTVERVRKKKTRAKNRELDPLEFKKTDRMRSFRLSTDVKNGVTVTIEISGHATFC